MRAFTIMAALGLLLGAVAVLPAQANNCQTTCSKFGNQTTCNTHCY